MPQGLEHSVRVKNVFRLAADIPVHKGLVFGREPSDFILIFGAAGVL